MIRFLIRTAIFFLSALVGLAVADLILDGFRIDVGSYIFVAVIFALLQGILSPLILKMVHKNANAFIGGVGLVSTFVALFITNIISDGLTITGVATWILATLIVWLAGAIAAFVLPFFMAKKVVDERRN
jgi:hypothetical protein